MRAPCARPGLRAQVKAWIALLAALAALVAWFSAGAPGCALLDPPRPLGRSPRPPAVSLPGGFPDDLPSYPDARVTDASGPAESPLAVRLQVDAPVDEVASFYAGSLVALGWTVEHHSRGDDHVMFAEKDSRTLSLSVAPVAGWTQIEMFVLAGG